MCVARVRCLFDCLFVTRACACAYVLALQQECKCGGVDGMHAHVSLSYRALTMHPATFGLFIQYLAKIAPVMVSG